jgi:ABC-type branched-subunit amino acid transport system substrate-binding protein
MLKTPFGVRRAARLTSIIVVLGLAVSVAAVTNGVAQAASSAHPAKASCSGAPIKLTTIAPLTGPYAVSSVGLEDGTTAALKAVNTQCQLGRPIQVKFCDDQGDVNTSTACGEQAKSDGSLGIISDVGIFDNGAEASGLPGVFVQGTSTFELTSPKAYSAMSGLVLALSSISGAKALGAKNYLMVLPDTPAFEFAAAEIGVLAKVVHVKYTSLLYPADTTDFAPVAAEIAADHPAAIGMAPTALKPFVSALYGAGITPKKEILCLPSLVIDPQDIQQAGKLLNGFIVVSQQLPPSDTANAGIDLFRQDIQKVGFSPNAPNIDLNSVLAWSNVMRLEGALAKLSKKAIRSLNSATLVKAIVAHPIASPVAAPYNFGAQQFPQFPTLKPFRLFTRQVAILRLENGQLQTLSNGFVDVTKPPHLS